MSLLHAHRTAAAVVVFALAAVGAVFVFARPAYHPTSTEKLVDVSTGHHYTVGAVSRAFAAQGIHLARTSGRLAGAASFTDAHPRSRLDDGFLVTIWSSNAKIHVSTSGPRPRYDKWVGNVDVFYGGLSDRFASRVSAAADALGK